MGKLKKKSDPAKEDGQKKISSFFQKPSSTAKPSALFTQLGGTSGRLDQKKTLSLAQTTNQAQASGLKANPNSNDIVILSDSEDFVETKKSPKTKAAVSNKISHDKKQHPFADLKKGATSLSSVKSKCTTAEPTTIPETQFAFTPEAKTTDIACGTAKEKENTFVSPVTKFAIEDGIIPDTPENISDKTKTKRPLSRSFLLPSSQFASNPIQKAKENREAKLAMKRKRAALAKNSAVSVNFKADSKLEEDIKSKNPFKCIESVNNIEQSNAKYLSEISTTDKCSLKEDSDVAQDECTPTKVYSNSLCIKRMSKSGLSPENKKLAVPDIQQEAAVHGEQVVKQLEFNTETNRGNEREIVGNSSKSDNVTESMDDSNDIEKIDKLDNVTESMDDSNDIEKIKKSDNVTESMDDSNDIEKINERFAQAIEQQEKAKKEQEAEKEKVRQQEMAVKKSMQREERKKNSEKLMKYQLGDTVRTAVQKDFSLVEDDALDDILQELQSPGAVKANSTETSKIALKHGVGTKRGTNKKLTSHRNSDGESGCVTKIKKYSLNKVLTFGSVEKKSDKTFEEYGKRSDGSDMDAIERPCDANVRNDMNEVYGEAKKQCSARTRTDITDTWTEEDERYFAELGYGTIAVSKVKAHSVKENKFVKSDKTSENLMECSIKSSMVDSSNIDVTNNTRKSKTMCVKANKLDDGSCNVLVDTSKLSSADLDTAENITVYPTQHCQESARSTLPCDEMEIEEYGTQTESRGICQKMEGLSPFKQIREQESGSQPQISAPCVEYGRHLVTGIQHDSCKPQTVLQISSQPGEVNRTCILHGFWLDTHVQEGDVVNVLAIFENDVCHITDTQGLLVVNPDLLLSGTTIVSSVFCMRRSILKEKFKGCDSRNIQMLYGSIIHSVFQQVLRKKLVTEAEILTEASCIVRQNSNLMEMYSNKVTEEKVMSEIKSYLPQIMGWTRQYTNIGQDILGNQRSSSVDVMVTKIQDIEENIWSPRFGVKGKIDLTVQARVKGDKGKYTELPLELKTGRPSYSVEHKGQVTLYSMMSSDRRPDPRKGLLLYLKDASMKVIPADHINQKGLIQLRNEMAYYISRQVVKSADDNEITFTLGRLPEPISNQRACEKCPQLLNCAVYQRMVEDRSHDNSGMSGLVSETLEHLTFDHMTYFTQWCLMLDLESQTDRSKRTVADIWCKSSIERERLGQCLGGMVLKSDSSVYPSQPVPGDGDSVILSFTKEHKHISITSCGLTTQDSVVVSCERPSWIAVCTGFVQHVTEREIAVLIDSDACDRLRGLKDRVFRIDKCDSFSTAGIFYTNVSRLMVNEAHSERLRHLIIDKVKPEFQNTLSKNNIEKVKPVFKTLNKPQKTAILKVLMSKDYVLIKGYPGTGKTSTIVALVKVLHALGQSVLLTSYTHSAVDNILLKLKKDNVKFLRLGQVSKIHKDIQEFSAERLTHNFTTTNEMDAFFHSQTIVATSCLGTSHPLFSQRRFDVCIVDEGSQVLQPACLGPLFSSSKFVLVGDPQQLPPVVQSKEARALGMADSLFARLDGLGATFDLTLQYRMNSEIMYLSNKLVYRDGLKCGSADVANRTLQLPRVGNISQMLELSPWMTKVVSGDLESSVVFLDTQKISAPETKNSGTGIRNETEARLVTQMATTLIKAGLQPCEMGVIAPYRSQVTFIRKCLLDQGEAVTSEVEVNTVDQYQGRDKSLIIISFVRSLQDSDTKTGELLKDIRRLNVAMTRAKMKLVLLGHVPTLRQYEPLQQMISLIEAKQQITCLT